MPSSSSSKKLLKLHLYDHCPYCIRVELAMGWQNIHYERIVYGYGDKLGDETKQGCYSTGVVLTGKKELPVLEQITIIKTVDGKEEEVRDWLKAESLDIIDWVQSQPGCSPFAPKSNDKKLAQFFDTNGRFKILQRIVLLPRYQKMIYLKDWMREEDRSYAKTKYEKGGFDYDAAEKADCESIEEMNLLLQEFETTFLPLPSDTTTTTISLYPTGIPGYDDLLYLPELRTVTVVAKGVVWPARLKQYVVSAHAKANVETYFNNQVE